MKSLRIALWAMGIAAAAAPPAHACRVVRSPQQRIAATYEGHPDLKIAIVKIERARHVMNRMLRDGLERNPQLELPWRAVASVRRLVKGTESPELVLFDWGFSNCDPPVRLPNVGDVWVVYYTVDSSMAPANVLQSYPLEVARNADPQLTE